MVKVLVLSMSNIHVNILNANIQYNSTCLNTIFSRGISCLLFLKTLGIPEHPKPHPIKLNYSLHGCPHTGKQ